MMERAIGKQASSQDREKAPHLRPGQAIKLSVIIKAFNEQDKIEVAVRSALVASTGLNAEVIVADSLSTDKTVEIAARYPVKIVQLLNARDRSCGIGPQLGFQYARGEAIYLMDGDMELSPDFLHAALACLEAETDVAGVGGLVEEENLVNLDFQSRISFMPAHMKAGEVDRLNMGGLYRRQAVEDAGYFSNRNLHAYEEFELALRLRAKGWRLLRLPQVAVKHYGHTISTLRLLMLRFHSRYAQCTGELLRAAIGKPYLFAIVKEFRVYLGVICWWMLLVGSIIALPWSMAPFRLVLAGLPVAATVMIFRKRGVKIGLYSVLSWNVYAAGTLLGLLRKQYDPASPIPSKILQDPTHQAFIALATIGIS